MLLPRSRAHPCLIYPQITPPSGTYGCCDLRKKTKGRTSAFRSIWKGLYLPDIPWGLPIFAQSHLKLLWVVRPCLWLVLEVMRGSGVCFLFVACCFRSLQMRKCTSAIKIAAIRRGESFNGVSARLVRAFESPPLRLFVPHLCHAACRIVIMAEDTKSLLGAWM